MRETCQVALPTGLCGKPAVDFIDESDDRFYLCAEHWDEFGNIGGDDSSEYYIDTSGDFGDFGDFDDF